MPPKTNRTIYLAEDDIDDQEFLGEALHSFDPDIKLISFTNGNKLINSIEKLPADELPCLIVLDYNIPELNGAEILEFLKKNDRYNHISKIIWSTSNSDKFKSNCLALGAVDYVIKPSNLSGIQLIAEKFLRFCNA